MPARSIARRSAGTEQGGEASLVDERETVGVDDDRLRLGVQGVNDGRHEPLGTGRIERALNDNGDIAAPVADLDAQQLSAEGLHGIWHMSPSQRHSRPRHANVPHWSPAVNVPAIARVAR